MPENTFIAPLGHLGVIAVEGDDAASFLHNQLTNDVLGLNDTTARLAGYCSPKGRLLATFLMWRTSEAIFLMLPRADAIELDMTVDEALKYIISMGVVAPSEHSKNPHFH